MATTFPARVLTTPDDAPASRVLIDAVMQLSLARTLVDVQEIVRGAARALSGADGATFVLREGETCVYADEDAIAPLWKGSRFPLESCISGWAMLNRQSVAIEDIYADDRIPHDAYRPTFVTSLAIVPIRSVEPIGAIGAYWAERHHASDEEVELLQALADSTAVAMENVQLWQELERRLEADEVELESRGVQLQEAHASVNELLVEATARGQDLTSAVEHQRNLLNSLAHEVRSPLTACDLMLDEVLTDFGVEGAAAENIVDARRCIAEAVEVVKAQLQRARLEAGVHRPRVDTVDVQELYLALRGMVRALRRSDDVELEFHAEDQMPKIETDPQMLGQILRNLIGNALKFTSTGSVSVSARFDPASGEFTFSVRDTGLGIPAADREHIFEDFGQVEGQHQVGRAGTGLGLPLSSSLAKTLGGSLELAESSERGSTFVVRLPANAPAPASA
jgi:signal transduction histidine kinase